MSKFLKFYQAQILIGIGALMLLIFSAIGAWPFALAAGGVAAMMILYFEAIRPLIAGAIYALFLIVGALSSRATVPLDTVILALVLIALAVALRTLRIRRASMPSAAVNGNAEPPTVANEILTRIASTVDGMVKSAQAVDEVIRQQTNGAREQINVIESSNQRLDQYIDLSRVALNNIGQLTKNAANATNISREGQEALQQAISGISQIHAQVALISETTVQLAQLTERIDRIITSVSEIATQSNLLALNASIEAARAGAHGRGFAVVAEEVRVLAQQSTQAAQQVRAILGEIQSAVRATVESTHVGMEQAEMGAVVAQSANRIMGELDVSVSSAYQAVKEMAGMIREQADGMEEMAIQMERVNLIAQQNLAGARTVEQVARSLAMLASSLEQSAR